MPFAFSLLPAAEPLSHRVVEYNIQARLDPESKTLQGRETIIYHHEGEEDLPSLQFHLYWNAFRDSRSTFQRELALASPDRHFDDQRAGRIDITSLRLDGGEDLLGRLRYIHPDDRNAEDRTVAEVVLPEPAPAGSAISIQIAFQAHFPEMAPRAGYRHDFFMAGQWFPKLGVLQNGVWNTHQYHASSEFFSDFGVYTVELTLPRSFVVAASGDLISQTDDGGGNIQAGAIQREPEAGERFSLAGARPGVPDSGVPDSGVPWAFCRDCKTLTYRAEDVHDFAWAAWPRFRRVEERWHNVRLELYFPPEHRQAHRHLEAARAALEWLDRNVGPYPYPRLVIVDTPIWADEAAGMEYPTLFTTTMHWWMPRAAREPEVITIHEVGHQYFYGMLANNEFEEAWLDEGINSYVETAIADWFYGPERSGLALPVLHASDAALDLRAGLVRAPPTDAVLQPAWRYWNPRAYGRMTYAKSLYLLRTVEQMVGRETLWKALRVYFERWRFRHPKTRDFLDALRETAGRDLDWFFSQALYSPGTLDYGIAEVATESLGEKRYLHHVRVRRLGDMAMPVEMTARFADGSSGKRFWDGRSAWYDFAMEARAEFASAQITVWPLDINRVDNSYSRKPSPGAAAKFTALWAFLIQHVLEIAAWLL